MMKKVIRKINEIVLSIKHGYISERLSEITELIDYVFQEYLEENNADLFDLCICSDCYEIIDTTIGNFDTIFDEKIICSDCRDNNYFSCSHCGNYTHNDDSIETGDHDSICQECRDEHYSRCDNCGEIYLTSETNSDEEVCYCDECYNDTYCRCASCGNIIHIDNARYNENNDNYYCETCHRDNDTKGYDWLHSYGYHPTLIFYEYEETTELYFGTETEIDQGNRDNFNSNISSLPSRFYCCEDGSLSSDGIEIISHPMSYNYIMKFRPHKKMCEMATKSGYKSHNTQTCGTHIHMSRAAFGSDNDRLMNFVFLFEKFWREIVVFSRRKHNFSVFDTGINAIDRYSSRYCDLGDDKEIKTVEKIKDKARNNCGRYRVVNLTNNATIEIRVFRGTLKENTIIASIQLCKLFYDISTFSPDTLELTSWIDITAYAEEKGYTEFIEYCKIRSL